MYGRVTYRDLCTKTKLLRKSEIKNQIPYIPRMYVRLARLACVYVAGVYLGGAYLIGVHLT
jgi:hypothetical protein